MRKLRILASVLVLVLALHTAGGEPGDDPRTREENRTLWGVMYKDALLLAKADEGEEMPQDEPEVVFVWPLWDSLLRFLGLS